MRHLGRFIRNLIFNQRELPRLYARALVTIAEERAQRGPAMCLNRSPGPEAHVCGLMPGHEGPHMSAHATEWKRGRDHRA